MNVYSSFVHTYVLYVLTMTINHEFLIINTWMATLCYIVSL